MQDFKSTLNITFERWFAIVAELLVRLFFVQDSSVSSPIFAGKLRGAGKLRENVSGFIHLRLAERSIFSPEIVRRIIPDRLG